MVNQFTGWRKVIPESCKLNVLYSILLLAFLIKKLHLVPEHGTGARALLCPVPMEFVILNYFIVMMFTIWNILQFFYSHVTEIGWQNEWQMYTTNIPNECVQSQRIAAIKKKNQNAFRFTLSMLIQLKLYLCNSVK